MKFLAVVFLLLPALASAEESEAKRSYERGTAAYALGHYDDAAEAYEHAFTLRPDAALLYNAAQAHRLAGHKTRALLLYENYLRVYSKDVQNREDVVRLIDGLKASIEADKRSATAAPMAPAATTDRPQVAPAPAPVVAAPAPAADDARLTVTTSPPPPKPLVRRPWFWAVTGGAAVAIVVGVTLGVVLGAPKNPAVTLGSVAGN